MWRRLTESRLLPVLVAVLDALAFALGRFVRAGGDVERGDTVLVVAPGGGNIGDDALAEAAVANRSGRIHLTGGPVDVDRMDPRHRVRTRPLELDGLFRANLLARVPTVARLAAALRRGARLDVVGADVMDGGYDPMLSVQRWSLATRAAAAAVPAQVLAFSWSDAPSSSARSAMRRASRRFPLLARDPVSARRLRADGARAVRDVADIVFTMTDRAIPDDVGAWIGEQRRAGRRIAAVNVSGLISRRLDQLPSYATAVATWLEQGWSVVLVPHVSRAADDDTVECGRLAARFEGQPALLSIDRILRPAEIRGLVAAVDVVVSGRMHLSVMALSAGTPAVMLEIQGKVEGLCELARPLAAWIRPGDGLAEDLPTAVATVLGSVSDRDRVEVPERLRSLARENFPA